MKKKRRIELDVARATAIILVLLCHATEIIYMPKKITWLNLSTQSKIFMTFSFVLGRLGVPIFLLLTGALILSKNFQTDKKVVNFYKKNLLPLVTANVIWIVIYNLFFLINNQKELVSVEFVVKELLLLKEVPLPNMWYIPMIIGIYIASPFVSIILKKFSIKTLGLLLGLDFICFFILPMINTILNMIGINDLYSIESDIYFFGGSYGLYVILGYYLDKKKKYYNKTKLLIIIAVLSFTISCAFQYISYSCSKGNIYNIWYNFPFLLICSICIYKLLLNIDCKKINKKIINIISFISKTSLSTFFLHIIIRNIITPYVKELNIMMPIQVLLVFLLEFIICMLINMILCRVKVISKYVMLIKE